MDGWRAHFARRPFGFARADAFHGVLCATVAAAAGAELSPAHFMLGGGGAPEPEPEKDLISFLQEKLPPAAPPGRPRAERG
jgi:hypothetical protein